MKNAGKTTRGELRAILAVVALLILATVAPTIYEKMASPQHVSDPVSSGALTIEHVQPMASEYPNSINKQSTAPAYAKRSYSKTDTQKSPRFARQESSPVVIDCLVFDPNTVQADELTAMGVSAYVAQNIAKFRQAGGSFRQAGDLRKIYGMDSTTYASLAACIEIPSSIAQRTHVVTIDINIAGMDEWKSLPGIGEGYARRILNFRNALGGFISIDQVAETYGLPEETFAAIRGKLMMSGDLRAIDINTAEVSELAAHPYITHKQAETIVNYRSHHGSFAQVDDLMHIYSLNSAWLSRVHQYLRCGAEPISRADIASR